ncbi:ATP-dependent RNA helicase DHX8-like [Uloborus diversus]|uniref:ATP-dependent RNA helicase DHX8-like n=1 Tax=Uloborus diversus TaxID=327109 RepID=UPI002409198A|nr:ATP-dependent RNA helicase DHX8-like [Uloborus diversus]
MEEIRKLEYLSLVSKICTELENHLGINDKDLAEFIIDLARKNESFEAFRKALLQNGAEFTDSFMSNLLRIIQQMKPSSTLFDDIEDEDCKTNSELQKQRERFPCLSLPNNDNVRNMLKDEDEIVLDDEDELIVADALALFEARAPGKKSKESPIHVKSKKEHKHKKSKSSDLKRKHSRERHKRRSSRSRSRSHSPSKKKVYRYSRSRSRSYSPSKKKVYRYSRSRSRSPSKKKVHRYSRSRSRSYSPSKKKMYRYSRSRSRSPKKEMKKRHWSRSISPQDQKRHYDSDKHRYNDKRKEKEKPEPLPLEPVVGKIYNGKVTNIMQFGCFVQLESLRKRWEGLVHISQLRREGRVTSVGDVVQKGQRVKVKVLSFTGQKTSLSMKDVDQYSGEDLNPSVVCKTEPSRKLAQDILRNPDRPSSFPLISKVDDSNVDTRRHVQRISSPERWEIKQMLAANCIDQSELPDFDETTGLLPKDEDDDEDIENRISRG